MKAVVRFCNPDSFGLSSQTDAHAARTIFGADLDQKRAERIGASIHYALGIGTGAAYAAATVRYPALRAGRGAAFGAGLWLVGDELAVSAARLESPSAANVFSHGSALAAHLVYGFIVDACSSTAA
jgi:type IV secretory pathway TrbD component